MMSHSIMLHKNTRRNTKKATYGFTLMEVVIYMALFTIMMTTLMSVFYAILDTQLDSEATAAAEADTRYVYMRLAYDILRSSKIENPSSVGDAGSTLKLQIGGVLYIYELINKNLMLTVNGDSDNKIQINSEATVIEAPLFRKLGTASKPAVKIQMTVRSRMSKFSVTEAREINSTISLR